MARQRARVRNAIERAVILWPSPVIEPQAFPERIAAVAGRGSAIAVGADVSVEELERAHISAVVARCRTMDDAAKIGIDISRCGGSASGTKAAKADSVAAG